MSRVQVLAAAKVRDGTDAIVKQIVVAETFTAIDDFIDTHEN